MPFHKKVGNSSEKRGEKVGIIDEKIGIVGLVQIHNSMCH